MLLCELVAGPLPVDDDASCCAADKHRQPQLNLLKICRSISVEEMTVIYTSQRAVTSFMVRAYLRKGCVKGVHPYFAVATCDRDLRELT